LSFLPLKDLSRLVRCSRRFHGLARKERSRGLQLKGGSNIVPLPSSALSHHVTSLHLERVWDGEAPLTLYTLQQLHDLPWLTSLQLTLHNEEAVDYFMIIHALPLDDVAAALRAVLPPQLRSFSVTLGYLGQPLHIPSAILASSFRAALGGMTQLTELSIEQYSEHNVMHILPELTQLRQLRKMTLGPARFLDDIAELKRLSQLRELTLHEYHPERIRLLCQPPHSLQLETLVIPFMKVDETTMRALLHLPTLTALRPGRINADAWTLFHQLPLLRRLYFHPLELVMSEWLTSLCTSLSRCSSLEHLTLRKVHVSLGDDGSPLAAERQRAGWVALLSSVPRLRRLNVDGELTHLLPVLPLHLPLLEHLTLSGWGGDSENCFATLALPNVRLLELGPFSGMPALSDEQLRAWIHSERFPKLERCIRCSDFSLDLE
jgi:hypothetical protein